MRRFVGLPGSTLPVLVAVLVSALVTGCGGAASEPTRAASPVAKAPQAGAPLPTPTRPALATPGPKPAGSPVAVASPVAKPTSGPGETYEVQAGDTLASIAERFYDDRAEWRRIYEANRDVVGDSPDTIQVGMKLRIPPKP